MKKETRVQIQGERRKIRVTHRRSVAVSHIGRRKVEAGPIISHKLKVKVAVSICRLTLVYSTE